MIHTQLRFTGCRRRSLGDHIVQDIEGLGVSTKHQGAAHHVQAVDRQRLSRDQAANGPIRGEIQTSANQRPALPVRLHPVLDSLVAQPRRHLDKY